MFLLNSHHVLKHGGVPDLLLIFGVKTSSQFLFEWQTLIWIIIDFSLHFYAFMCHALLHIELFVNKKNCRFQLFFSSFEAIVYSVWIAHFYYIF